MNQIQQTPRDFGEARARVLGAWRLLPDEAKADLTLLAEMACEVILADMASEVSEE